MPRGDVACGYFVHAIRSLDMSLTFIEHASVEVLAGNIGLVGVRMQAFFMK